MPSNPTPLLGVEQQAAGENLNVWGDPHLNDALQRLTEAIAATTAISSYPITLTSTNYVANQARNMILSCSGVGGTVTIPTQSKLYIVRNASSGNVTLTTGSGATAVVASGDAAPVICNGTDCYLVSRTDFQNAIIKNVATPVNTGDAANKAYADAILAAAQAYTDATAFESASLPGQAGQDGKFLQTNGSTTLWNAVYPDFTGTSGYFLYSNGVAAEWASPSSARALLSLGNSALLNVGTTAATVAAGDDPRIVGAAQKSGAVFTGAISGPSAAFTTFTGALAGNATTATTWATARNLNLTGDATGAFAGVNGSANVNATVTLANSGVSPGTYGGTTFDAKGRATVSLATSSGQYAFALVQGATGTITRGERITAIGTPGIATYSVTISPVVPSINYLVFITCSSASGSGLIATVDSSTKTTGGFTFYVLNANNVAEVPSEIFIQVWL